MEHKIPALEALLAWFLALPKTVQAGGAALTLITVGFVSALTLSGFTALPEVVEEHTSQIEAVNTRIDSIESQMREEARVNRRTLCILELQVDGAEVSLVEVNRRCP